MDTPKTPEEWRALMLSFIASLTLGDHMGDVANYIDTILPRIGVEDEWQSFDELARILDRMGVKTLHGGSPSFQDDPEPG